MKVKRKQNDPRQGELGLKSAGGVLTRGDSEPVATKPIGAPSVQESPSEVKEQPPVQSPLQEKHITIGYGESGYTYENLFGDYLVGATVVTVEDPFIRHNHQVNYFLRFCELVVKMGSAKVINLTTGYDDEHQKTDTEQKLKMIASSLIERGIKLNLVFKEKLHDREIQLDNGWVIKIGRGFDFYQKPGSWFSIGTNYYEFRPCLKTKVDVFRK